MAKGPATTTSSAKPVPGRAVRDILAESLPAAILGNPVAEDHVLDGAKTGPRFIRPIRWIVALLDDQVIPSKSPASKAATSPEATASRISVTFRSTIANYEAELRKNFVILSLARTPPQDRNRSRHNWARNSTPICSKP